MIADLRANLGLGMQKTLSLWKTTPKRVKKVKKRSTLNEYQRKGKIFKIIQLIVMNSPLAFEQQGF